MTKTKSFRNMSRILAAIALGSASGASIAQASGPNTTYLVPDNTVSVGVGYSSGSEKDRARFGMFNGLRENDGNLLLDFNYANRDPNSGRWMVVEGRNVGLDNREFSFIYRGLGDFRLKAEYGELVRHDPRTINTSLSGSGTATPAVSLLTTPGTGPELNLELKRQGLGFEGAKRFGNFEVEFTFKNEDKSGARLFGKGFACSTTYDRGAGVCSSSGSPTALLMLPEPVDSTIRQFEAKLNYFDGKLSLSGGYYGNFYSSNFGSLRPTINGATIGNLNGGTAAWDANLRTYMQTPMALWPDSQAHQLFLGGNYKLASHTKLNFKLAYTHATQDEDFGGMGLTGAPAGRSNLGGELNTTKAQLGFSSHPIDKLHVHGDIAYESRDNNTPVDIYNRHVVTNAVAPGAVVYGTWSNSAMSPKKYDVKLEANYRLPYNLLLTGGYKFEHEDVGTWTPTDVAGGITALRQKTDSDTWRAELKKTMSETFTGWVAYSQERRDGGSSWLRPLALPLRGVINASQDCAAGPAINTLAILNSANAACVYNRTGQIAWTQKNLQREKLRLAGNWSPADRFNVQFFYDYADEDYRGPTTSGLSNAKLDTLSLDADYQISDSWKVNAFATWSKRKSDTAHSSDYDATLKDESTTFGLGFSGKPSERFRIGGDLLAMTDTLEYNMRPDDFANAATIASLNASGGLPNVKYKLTQLKLFGEYLIDKASAVRLDYIYYYSFFNEWTYGYNGVPFLFSDNTTLSAKEKQTVNYLGVSYVYKFK